MAARKLQGEIDRTLKRVGEGVEQFEAIYDKMQTANNQTQKEKQEVELKSQIKKLQRMRDQIKTWLQSSEIKDKKTLLDSRKLIETQMERFKACEKEMKTKAFSKEGLNAATKLDPKEAAKVEISNWLSTMVDELSRQIEVSEAELESLQGSVKKKSGKGSAADGRASELEQLNERRKWHVGRLELVMRSVENGNLSVDEVTKCKDDIAYFVESNTEEDFEEDEGIYDDLNLQEEEEMFGMKEDNDLQSSHDSVSISEQDSTSFPLRTPLKGTTNGTDVKSVNDRFAGPAARRPTNDSVSIPRPTVPPQPIPKPTPAPAAPAPPKLGNRYAAAAAAAVQNTQPQATSSSPATASVSTQPSALAPSQLSQSLPPRPPTPSSIKSPPVAPASVSNATSPVQAAPSIPAALPNQVPLPTHSVPPTPASGPAPLENHEREASMSISEAGSPVATKGGVDGTSSRTESPEVSSITSVQQQLPPLSGQSVASPLPVLSAGQPSAPMRPAPLPQLSSESKRQQIENEQQKMQAQIQQEREALSGGQTVPSKVPPSLSDLIPQMEIIRQNSALQRMDPTTVHKLLDSGLQSAPRTIDADKPKYYVPKNPYATPSYYPQQPAEYFNNPAFFAKFDSETLFYIFYYNQGTYLQYLAAEELKKQSWRFHKQYLTWFQRANEPSVITEQYEQGVYLYFDWEGSWCQRQKADFRFEYRYLEG
ncbi:hypothetical protein BT69DRAFT_1237424 [Atractiella rhizophila]|nr:hypothetical protein BT69DRAFT_1237424 [Atractiella rhizophila]